MYLEKSIQLLANKMLVMLKIQSVFIKCSETGLVFQPFKTYFYSSEKSFKMTKLGNKVSVQSLKLVKLKLRIVKLKACRWF